MPSDLLTAEAVIAEARNWLGVPWRHQGRTREGLDCVGLLLVTAEACGIGHHDVTGYTRQAQGQGFVEHFRADLDEVRVVEARPADVLLFAEEAYPCHCGFLTAKHGLPHLLHAHATRRAVLEEPYTGEWPERVKFAFRIRELG